LRTIGGRKQGGQARQIASAKIESAELFALANQALVLRHDLNGSSGDAAQLSGCGL